MSNAEKVWIESIRRNLRARHLDDEARRTAQVRIWELRQLRTTGVIDLTTFRFLRGIKSV